MMKKSRKISLFVAFFFMVFSVMVFAAPGDLDPTFGTGGVATYNAPTNNEDYGFGGVIQKDGKIVVLGQSNNGQNDDILLLRYNTDGTLDDTFGTGGMVTYNSPVDFYDQPWGNGIALQNDGKIVVVGATYNGANNDVLVLRYTSDGILDDTFGIGGVVTYNGPANGGDGAARVAIQRDGKIVVVGGTDNGVNSDVLVLRYTSDGILDDTFGIGGVVTYNGPANKYDDGQSIAIQNDGKIVVVGKSNNGANFDVLVLRYTKKGILDTTFGIGGVVIYNGSANKDYANGVAIQNDGKIVVVGESSNGANDDVLVLRYTKQGILDTTFGTGGVITYNSPANDDDWAFEVTLQRDGKIVVAGIRFSGATNWDALIFRYTKKGIPDTTFGIGGVVTYNGPAFGGDWGEAVVIQKDGKIVVIGASSNGANYDVLVMRLLGK